VLYFDNARGEPAEAAALGREPAEAAALGREPGAVDASSPSVDVSSNSVFAVLDTPTTSITSLDGEPNGWTDSVGSKTGRVDEGKGEGDGDTEGAGEPQSKGQSGDEGAGEPQPQPQGAEDTWERLRLRLRAAIAGGPRRRAVAGGLTCETMFPTYDNYVMMVTVPGRGRDGAGPGPGRGRAGAGAGPGPGPCGRSAGYLAKCNTF